MNEPMAHEDWFVRLERERIEAVSQAKLTLRALCETLAIQGVEEVRLAYDGCGDSGVIERITALGNGQEIPLEESLGGQLRDAAYELLPAGWEINDGSFGELVLDVNDCRLTREHNWRVTETEYDEEEWNL